MTAPSPAPPIGTGSNPRGGSRGFDPRQTAVVAVVAVAAALAIAVVVLREFDQRRAPAIIIEDPRADATIVVAVTGEVATPGVYDFPNGARVDDALARAGGVGPAADLAGLNLARRLDDGEQLTVPRRQPAPATVPAGQVVATPPDPAPTATVATAMGVAGGDIGSHPIDINTASAAELETLPEIGETRATAIVAYREANGPFASVDELANVDGISERVVDVVRPFVTVGP